MNKINYNAVLFDIKDKYKSYILREYKKINFIDGRDIYYFIFGEKGCSEFNEIWLSVSESLTFYLTKGFKTLYEGGDFEKCLSILDVALGRN